MQPFDPDGTYNGIPYRVLSDHSIEAMMPGGLVKFTSRDQFAAASDQAKSNAIQPAGHTLPLESPVDYYAILTEAIRSTKQNSAQLRALVYERARFNLKREVLFGYSTMGLTDVVRQIHDFEHAVARIEAKAMHDELNVADREHSEPYRAAKSINPVQILPPQPVPPLYTGLSPVERTDNFQVNRVAEEFLRHLRFTNKFIGAALIGMAAIVGAVIITMIWPSHQVTSRIETANNSAGQTIVANSNRLDEATNSAKPQFPLPNSFGIYALSNNKLTELKSLPMAVPDPRIAISGDLRAPSTTTIADDRPSFIIFRRGLLNDAPEKIVLRVIAQIARETKFVNGKAAVTEVDGVWRIRNISRELKVSPIPGQQEMVMARVDDEVSLKSGRYALVLNGVGYDFTIAGAVQSPEFCLEKFETTDGSILNQCRTRASKNGRLL